MTVIVAPICGPILGGYISDNYHWGWIFFINVPIGVAVVLMTLQTLRGRETRTERRRIDAVGLALLVIGIGSLQIMLDRGKELDWFSSQEIIILTVVAVVAICFLIVWELTDDNPIVDLSLFKSRNFTIGCLCISLAYMLYFGAIVLLPQLLQEVYGYTATWAGLASAPVGIIPVILSPIIGRFAHKLDMRRLVTFSFIMYAVCFYWRAYTFEPGMDFGASAWPQFIQWFCGGLLLYAADHHYAVWFATGTTGGSIEPLQLYANAGGVYRHVDNHNHVDQPRVDAPCAVD